MNPPGYSAGGEGGDYILSPVAESTPIPIGFKNRGEERPPRTPIAIVLISLYL